MTNKDKILRYLECGLKVGTTSGEWYEYIIYSKERYDEVSESFVAYNVDSRLAYTYPLDFFEDCHLTPISLKPNYKPGDLVTILPIAREIDDYNNWCEEAKDMVASGAYEVKWVSIWDINVYAKYKSGYFHFPSWALAPAFPDEPATEATYTGKEITVTIDGKEYKAIIQ